MSTNGASNPPEKPSSDQVSSGNNDLSKDQVGWYFVEQYYNTVSKNPEKLHLYYGKNSQFVYGAEAEITKVAVGRQSIQERIKQLDFQDCKVRISNVDTQASYDNIVIQVIGEFSNKGGEPKKFVQTFILAQQPSGYFVLNDILRCIKDDDFEEDRAETQEPETPAALAPALESATGPDEPEDPDEPDPQPSAVSSLDTGVVDKKLEEVTETVQADSSSATDSALEVAEPNPEATQKALENASPDAEAPDPDVTARQIAEEDVKKSEKPKDPSPTPVTAKTAPPNSEKPAAAPAPAPAQVPASAPAPVKPMTWASRLAASTPRPVVPLKAATPPAPAQTRAPAPSQPSMTVQPAASQHSDAPAPSRKDQNEWQTAGENSKRQNRPQSMLGTSGDKESRSCYVKYVSEKVQQEDLRAALSAHGELSHFDINRQKNCAFVEYATLHAYQAAIAASPYTVNGENITVEPRRKPGGHGGTAYGPSRGGIPGRGRGGFDGGRSGSQRGSFGSPGGRGRGAARGLRSAGQVSGS